MDQHTAQIDYTREENEEGREQDCVYATCNETDETAGPVCGHSEASVKRALAMLREQCEDVFHAVEEE